MASPLKASVQSVTDTGVTLLLPNGTELTVPLSAFEGTPKSGLDAYLVIAVPGAEDAGRQTLARDLLNQLLGSKKG